MIWKVIRNILIVGLILIFVTMYFLPVQYRGRFYVSHKSNHVLSYCESYPDTSECVLGHLSNRTTNESCLKLSSSNQGRLGNQLFQLGIVFDLAITTGRCLVMVESSPVLEVFPDVIAVKLKDHGKWVLGRGKHLLIMSETSDLDSMRYSPSYPTRVLQNNNTHDILLSGYFQSYKYFEKHHTALLDMLQFQSNVELKVKQFLNFNRKNQSDLLVGVHIRRGDMASGGSIAKGYVAASQDYLARATKHLQKRYPNNKLTFLVCSDDLSWAKASMPNASGGAHVLYIEGYSLSETVCILALCDHLIITVGTFGVWSGYLNRHRHKHSDIVYQKAFYKPNTPIGNIAAKSQYVFPPDWISL